MIRDAPRSEDRLEALRTLTPGYHAMVTESPSNSESRVDDSRSGGASADASFVSALGASYVTAFGGTPSSPETQPRSPDSSLKKGAEWQLDPPQAEVGIVVARGGSEALQGMLVLQLLYHPDIRPHVCAVINAAVSAFCACQYLYDEQFIAVAVINALKRGVTGRMVLDKQKMRRPASWRQPEQVALAIENGLEVRLHQPDPSSLFSAQHEKSVIVDEAIVLVGSANWTRNSMEHCEESVISTRAADVVAQASVHFEQLWLVAEPFSAEEARACAPRPRPAPIEPRRHSVN